MEEVRLVVLEMIIYWVVLVCRVFVLMGVLRLTRSCIGRVRTVCLVGRYVLSVRMVIWMCVLLLRGLFLTLFMCMSLVMCIMSVVRLRFLLDVRLKLTLVGVRM